MIGPFPVSTYGNKYIVTVVDVLTKWLGPATIPDKESTTIANFFVRDIISPHDTPQSVVCDNGQEFARAFRELLDNAHIVLRHSSANHPQTNGLIERFNQNM